MKKVLIFGTFDGLHLGHLNFFEQAKEYGDCLIAVVARDKTVKKTKKRFPLNDEIKRLEALQRCKLINEARLGYKDNPYRIIKEINPDVICFGYDQAAFVEDLPKELEKMKLRTKIYKMKPFRPQKYHSSIINGSVRF